MCRNLLAGSTSLSHSLYCSKLCSLFDYFDTHGFTVISHTGKYGLSVFYMPKNYVAWLSASASARESCSICDFFRRTHTKKRGKETMKLIVNSKLQFYVNTLKDKDSINCTFLNFNVIHMLKLEENRANGISQSKCFWCIIM